MRSPHAYLSIPEHLFMKRTHLIAVAAAGLAAVLSAGTATAAATKLFNFDNEVQYAAPSFGTSVGTVLVDDGSLTGVSPPGKHLLLDTQGTGNFSGLRGNYSVPAPAASISYFQFSFTVAAPTTFYFYYNFLTSTSLGDGDFFVGALFNASNAQTNLFSETSSTALLDSASGYLYESGIRYKEFSVAAGSYTTEFVVGTNQAGCLNFGLCLPSAGQLNYVSEPVSIALVGLALLGLASPLSRRKAKALLA